MSDKLAEMLVAIKVDLDQLKKGLDQGKSQTESFKRAIEANTRASAVAFDKLDQSVKQSVAKQGASLEALKSGYVKMAAAATAAFLAVRKAWNMAEAAASLEEQRGALDILGRQYGQTADQIVDAVKKASGAQLSLRDSTMLATKALQAGFSPQQVAKLVQGAEMLADRTGEDIPTAFDKLTKAIKTGRDMAIKMQFANLSLVSSLKDEGEELGETSVQGENFNRVAGEIDAMQRQLAGSTESTADRMGRFKADVQDMSEYINTTALRATAALAASMMGIKEAAEYASLAMSSIISDSARGLAWLNENMPFADNENRKKALQFRAVQSGADADVRRLEGQFSESARRGNSFLDIMYNGPTSGIVKPRSNVRATGTDYINILNNWKKQRTGSGGGGRTSGASSSAPTGDKVADYINDLRQSASEVGMSEYEVGISRVIARLQELGATEAQVMQGKAIFAAGYEKKKLLEEMGDAADYAKKATSELGQSFVELEAKYGMVAAETEKARAEYQAEAVASLPGIFGDLDSQYGMNPADTEGARNASIASWRDRSQGVLDNLTPYDSYIASMRDLNAARASMPELAGQTSDVLERSYLETMIAEATASMELKDAEFERYQLQGKLSNAVSSNAITTEQMTEALYQYDAQLAYIAEHQSNAITSLVQLSDGFGAAMQGWQKSFDVTKDIQKTVQDFAGGIEDSFFAMIQSGQDFSTSMSGVLKTVLADIASLVFQITVIKPLMSGVEGALSGMGWISGTTTKSGLGSNSLKGFASGGYTKASMPIVVGEEGPEIFVPGAAGSIIPNHQLAAGGSNVSVTLNVPAGVSKADLARILPAYQKATMAAIADANQRGGSFSAALG